MFKRAVSGSMLSSQDSTTAVLKQHSMKVAGSNLAGCRLP